MQNVKRVETTPLTNHPFVEVPNSLQCVGCQRVHITLVAPAIMLMVMTAFFKV